MNSEESAHNTVFGGEADRVITLEAGRIVGDKDKRAEPSGTEARREEHVALNTNRINFAIHNRKSHHIEPIDCQA